VCGRNALTTLDVGGCPRLSELRASHNALTSPPSGLGARLRVLDCGSNPGLGPLAAVVASLAGKPWRDVPLVALEDVKEAGIFGRAIDTIRLWFK
jgi:D-alanyl-D-alanine carboxypeptidase (penicillin-binding protein 5/6)